MNIIKGAAAIFSRIPFIRSSSTKKAEGHAWPEFMDTSSRAPLWPCLGGAAAVICPRRPAFDSTGAWRKPHGMFRPDISWRHLYFLRPNSVVHQKKTKTSNMVLVVFSKYSVIVGLLWPSSSIHDRNAQLTILNQRQWPSAGITVGVVSNFSLYPRPTNSLPGISPIF